MSCVTLFAIFTCLIACGHCFSAGFAVVFDGKEADVISVQRSFPETKQLTVQYWVYLLDQFSAGDAVVSYGAYRDDATRGRVDVPQQFSIVHSRNGTKITCQFDQEFFCDEDACKLQLEEWVLVTLTINTESGTVALYINGQLAMEETDSKNNTPINSDGCLLLGQLGATVCGDFDPRMSLTGVLDEFCMWTRALTADEIMRMFKADADPNSDFKVSQDLLLYWDFDTHGQVIDMSGNGNHGTIGFLLRSVGITWLKDRPARFSLPTPPLFVKSTAPIIKHKHVAPIRETPEVTVRLPVASHHSNNITVRILITDDSRDKLADINNLTRSLVNMDVIAARFGSYMVVVREPNPVAFEYTIEDHAMGVTSTELMQVLPFTPYVPNNPSAVIEKNYKLLRFGSPLQADATKWNRIILPTLPACGAIHQVLTDRPGSWDDFEDLIGPVLVGTGAESLSIGAVIYYPYDTATGLLCASGKLKFTVAYEGFLRNINEDVALRLTGQVDPIIPQSIEKRFDIGISAYEVELADPRNKPLVLPLDDFPLLRTLTKPPRIGTITLGNNNIVPLSSTVIEQHVLEVTSITASGSSGNITVDTSAADALLGKPDTLKYAPSPQAYEIKSQIQGAMVELVTLEFKIETPVYVNSVTIFESYNTGSATKISQSMDGENWKQIWAAVENMPHFDSQQQRLNAFQPHICLLLEKAQYIQLEFRPSEHSTYGHFIDAVSVVGESDARVGNLGSAKIRYTPISGISRGEANNASNIVDELEYTTRSCFGFETTTQVSIIVQDGLRTFGEATSFDAIIGRITEALTVNLTSIRNDARERNIPEDQGAIVTLHATAGLSVWHDENENKQIALNQNMSCSEDGTEITVCSFRVIPHRRTNCTMTIAVTLGDFVYRLGVEMNVIDVDKVSNVVTIVIYILGSLAIAFTLVLWVMTLVWRDTHQMKTSSIVFLILILVGALMLFSSTMIDINQGIAHCVSFIWLASLGFTCTYGTLFIRTYRVWRIFSNKKVKPVILPDIKLVGVLCCLFLLDIIILTSMHIFGDLGIKGETNVVEKIHSDQCEVSAVWIALLFIWKSLLIVFGIFISVSVRHVSSAYNESTYIGFAIYNLALTATVFVPLIFLINPDLTVKALLIFVLLWLSTTVTVSVIFLPKILSVLRGERLVNMQNSKAKYSMRFIKRSSSKKTTASTSPTEVMRATIEKLEKHVRDLQKQLADACIVENNDLSQSTCESYPTEASSIEGEPPSPGIGTLPAFNDVMISDITESEYDTDYSIGSRSFSYRQRRKKREARHSGDTGITSRSKSEIRNISTDSTDAEEPEGKKGTKKTHESKKKSSREK